MKLLVVAGALCVCAAVPSAAEVRFGGGGHSGISISSFGKAAGELYGIGFGGGVHADLQLLRPLVIRLSADYYLFPSDKSRLKDRFTVSDPFGRPVDFQVEGLNTSTIGITLNGIGRLPVSPTVTPYGLIGFGLHTTSASDLKITSGGRELLNSKSQSETDFGLAFGAGSEFRLGRTTLFVDVRYTLIFASGETIGHFPITLGISF